MTDTARHPEILIAPVITFLAVLALLLVARFYDTLPVQTPECGFRERFSIPCAGCGGTRSMQALAVGDLSTALRLHPAAVVGVFLSLCWLVSGLRRYFRGDAPQTGAEQKRTFFRGILLAFLLLFLNWLYLLKYLP